MDPQVIWQMPCGELPNREEFLLRAGNDKVNVYDDARMADGEYSPDRMYDEIVHATWEGKQGDEKALDWADSTLFVLVGIVWTN